jgi:hypothetical protein
MLNECCKKKGKVSHALSWLHIEIQHRTRRRIRYCFVLLAFAETGTELTAGA